MFLWVYGFVQISIRVVALYLLKFPQNHLTYIFPTVKALLSLGHSCLEPKGWCSDSVFTDVGYTKKDRRGGKSPGALESTRMRAWNRAATIAHGPHVPAERCSRSHPPRSTENNSHPKTQLYKSAGKQRVTDTESDGPAISCSETSVLHLCQALRTDFGFYYLMRISHLQGCADLCLFHLRRWSWKTLAQPARQIKEQTGDAPPRMPAANSLSSFKKLKEETFAVCLSNVSGNNPH